MSIKIESTSDTPEQVAEALGQKASDKKAAPVETPSEKESESAVDQNPDDVEATANDETEGDEESTEDESEGKTKKRSGFKRRIDKLNRKLTDREKEVEYWKAV